MKKIITIILVSTLGLSSIYQKDIRVLIQAHVANTRIKEYLESTTQNGSQSKAFQLATNPSDVVLKGDTSYIGQWYTNDPIWNHWIMFDSMNNFYQPVILGLPKGDLKFSK